MELGVKEVTNLYLHPWPVTCHGTGRIPKHEAVGKAKEAGEQQTHTPREHKKQTNGMESNKVSWFPTVSVHSPILGTVTSGQESCPMQKKIGLLFLAAPSFNCIAVSHAGRIQASSVTQFPKNETRWLKNKWKNKQTTSNFTRRLPISISQCSKQHSSHLEWKPFT